jgi:hypothetical protein
VAFWLPPLVLPQVPLWAGQVRGAFWQEQLQPLEQVLEQFQLPGETANWYWMLPLCMVLWVARCLGVLAWQKSLL